MWDKAFPKSFKNFRTFDLGLKAHHMGDFKGAVRCFKRIVETEPDVSFGWYMLLECLSYIGKWEEMIKVGERALKLHPNFGPSYSWIGDAYNQLGKQKQAMDCYKKGYEHLEKELVLIDKKLVKYPQDANATILNSLGEINIRFGNYEEAIKYNKRAFEIRQDEHNLHSLGLAYKEMGDYDNAIDYLKRSLDVNPKHSYAWFDLGLIYEDLKKSKEAIECFEKAVESKPQWVKLREKLLEVKPDSLALLKKAPDIGILLDGGIAQDHIKSDIIIDDLKEIETLLKDNNLSAEERKYFEKRKLILKNKLKLDETDEFVKKEEPFKVDKRKQEKKIDMYQKKQLLPLMNQKSFRKKFKKTFKYICKECGNFLHTKREICKRCGARTSRKATEDNYVKIETTRQTILNRMAVEQKKVMKARTKMGGIIDKQLRILQAKVKNDEEYKSLLKRKKAGEAVEDLIIQNRNHKEKLDKEDKESSEIALDWGRSEEGRKMFELMSMWSRRNPNLARKRQIKLELELRIDRLNDKIEKNKEEYEDLLERKNKGEFVDDLITQNRYTTQALERNKNNAKKALNRFTPENNPDWKSRIKK